MTDVETLRVLLARVEGAAGADREIDGDLVLAFGGVPDDAFPFLREGAWTYRGQAEWVTLSPRSLGLDVVWKAPAYTASVDAALALVGRVMPGADCSVHLHKQGNDPHPKDAWAGVREPARGRVSGVLHESNGYTPALALLAALLRAKIAETDNG